MKQEDKELLLKDLCARLPYGVKCKDQYGDYIDVNIYNAHIEHLIDQILSGVIQMVLRPMSSMTEEEKKIMRSCGFELIHYDTGSYGFANIENCIDEVSFKFMEEFLNSHYFDYRGLIPLGLAIIAPDGMYNLEKNQLWQ